MSKKGNEIAYDRLQDVVGEVQYTLQIPGNWDYLRPMGLDDKAASETVSREDLYEWLLLRLGDYDSPSGNVHWRCGAAEGLAEIHESVRHAVALVESVRDRAVPLLDNMVEETHANGDRLIAEATNAYERVCFFQSMFRRYYWNETRPHHWDGALSSEENHDRFDKAIERFLDDIVELFATGGDFREYALCQDYNCWRLQSVQPAFTCRHCGSTKMRTYRLKEGATRYW